MTNVQIVNTEQKRYYTQACYVVRKSKIKREMTQENAEIWGYTKCAYCAAIDGEREDPSRIHGGVGQTLASDLQKMDPEEL